MIAEKAADMIASGAPVTAKVDSMSGLWSKSVITNDSADASNAVAEPVLTLTYGAVDAYPAVMPALSRPIPLISIRPFAQYEDVNEKARTALRLSNRR